MSEMLYLQDRDHPDQRDRVVRAENIRSPQDITIPITGGNLILHPLGPATSTLWVEVPGFPAVAAVFGGVVNLNYDPGVTTNAVMAAAVLVDLASSVQLAILRDPAAVIPGGLVPAAHNLWSDLIGVPGAMFRYNPANGRGEGWDGAIVGGAAMLAALTAIQANTAPDNRNGGITHSLDNGGAAFVDHSLGISGRTFRVLGLTGAASVRLVNGGVPYPTLPAAALDVYPLDYLSFDFTDVLLSCVSQPGLIISIYAGWRV